MEQHSIKLIECPRDAMQGWKQMIPTEKKIAYINALLQVGFDTIDFGSFVSPKAIPQMADTKQVLAGLDLTGSKSKLLAIIANERGAEEAVLYNEISYLGFPLSVSETFQHRNTNSSIAESLKRVEAIQELCIRNNKQLVVYLSMGFGNPYGDSWSEEIVFEKANQLANMGIEIISLADTVGLATADQVKRVTGHLIRNMPEVEIGVHLHSTAVNWREKLEAAYKVGCRRFDSALLGIGGCPMANDELVGNMDTTKVLSFFENKESLHLNAEALQLSLHLAAEIFN
ncbi:hydroxymethylglutaryl-CoA lyase [Lacibacter cauensis]|uniref:Hydroxymethylglutaryl-CoA lyase n=1 Tax=Lacibacter cauensis TaxID=510947 RepID=A0A562SVS4_9BACT|nr:hydroxymethylglutaryl-CoA lyase [Lacibacter cauensis]TWI85365.1 hydroxymethylglutaryl-CoA lyase [Lacibacter cauensis]